MSRHDEALRQLLGRGPASAARIGEVLGVSQQAVSRAVVALGDEVIRVGAARSTRYLLRDRRRGLPDVSVHRIGEDGRILRLGVLVPVSPQGWVMRPEQGTAIHHEGLPWWLADMCAAGFLGRAWAARHASLLGLPARLTEWDDSEHLRALLAQGHDAVGNLLLGDHAHERFLSAPVPPPVAADERGPVYARLAAQAALGEIPGSSAGGEQPKFIAFAETAAGPAHVIVKFTLPEVHPVTERWADLLLAEHHALETLREAGIDAARTELIDHGSQRFLQVERFDRVGALGRRALLSLAMLDAEFTGAAPAPWPVIVDRLAQARHVEAAATSACALLHAFGTLIGNTDMHPGNLSFIGAGRPYALAPAYDMLPMGLAPTAGGALPTRLTAPVLRPIVPGAAWRQALGLAERFMVRLHREDRFSARWAPCLQALDQHLSPARMQIERMASSR
ncbi:type II toxin-antitoxin system HipA family toxin YjjJ (plasmid) [Sphaerotilus sulfidivorans]|nr:putative kinase YjjJ [Sphaerotilus natans]